MNNDTQQNPITKTEDEQERFDIISKMPFWISEISHHLDDRDSQVFLVSKNWYRLFNDPLIWKKKICKEFNYPISLLNQFEEKFPEACKTIGCYRQIYAHLFFLEENKSNMIQAIKNFYEDTDKDHQLLLLACCTNDPEFFLSVIPKDEQDVWLQIALIGKMDRIYKELFNQNKNRFDFYFMMAARTANAEALQYLTDPTQGFKFKLQENDIYSAFENIVYAPNPFKSVYKLLEIAQRFNIATTDKDALCFHLAAGNLHEIKQQVDLIKEVIKDSSTKNKALILAINSRNTELIDYLLDPANNFSFNINLNVLNQALLNDYRIGNQKLLIHLLKNYLVDLSVEAEYLIEAFISNITAFDNPELIALTIEKTNFKNMDRILEAAVNTGSLKCIKYLLDPSIQPTLNLTINTKINFRSSLLNTKTENAEEFIELLEKKFFKKPDQDMLFFVAAVSPKNLGYLLNPKFGLCIDGDILASLIGYRNLYALRFILHPENRLNFNLNDITPFLNRITRSNRNFAESLEYLINFTDYHTNFIPSYENTNDHNQLVDTIKPALVNLIKCYMALQTALTRLAQNDSKADCSKYLEEAYHHSDRYFTIWTDYMLKHAEEFLPDEHAQLLLSEFKQSKIAANEPTLPTEEPRTGKSCQIL